MNVEYYLLTYCDIHIHNIHARFPQATLKLCQERVEDHKVLNQSLEETTKHLDEAEERLKPLKDLSGDRSSIDEKLSTVEVGTTAIKNYSVNSLYFKLCVSYSVTCFFLCYILCKFLCTFFIYFHEVTK